GLGGLPMGSPDWAAAGVARWRKRHYDARRDRRLVAQPTASDCYHNVSVTAVLRSLLRRLTGPLGRRLFFVLLVAGAWFRWAYLPPRPLIAWDRPTDRLIDHAIFAPDGMTFLTVEKLRSDAVCDSTTLWHLPSGRRIVALTDVTQAWPCPCFAP